MRTHYGILEWMEFARGTVPEETRSRMSSHLNEGCSDCQKTAAFFEKLTNVCRDMIPDDVSESMLQRARTICPHTVPRESGARRRIPAELIYDSSLAPAPLGLRASKVTGSRVLYRAGKWSLDFHLEPGLQASQISLIGQILREGEPQSVSYIPVALKSRAATVTETLTNQFGEFQMECKRHKNLRLCIYLERDTQFIEVPLQLSGTDTSGERT